MLELTDGQREKIRELQVLADEARDGDQEALRALRIALAGLRHADLSGDPPDETVIDRLYNQKK